MYKRRNRPGFKVSFEVKPRGWESPAAELRRRIAVLEEQNELLLNANRYKDSNLNSYEISLSMRLDKAYSREINLARRLDLAESALRNSNDLCNRLSHALEAAREKLIEQDSVIEKLVSRSGRNVISC